MQCFIAFSGRFIFSLSSFSPPLMSCLPSFLLSSYGRRRRGGRRRLEKKRCLKKQRHKKRQKTSSVFWGKRQEENDKKEGETSLESSRKGQGQFNRGTDRLTQENPLSSFSSRQESVGPLLCCQFVFVCILCSLFVFLLDSFSFLDFLAFFFSRVNASVSKIMSCHPSSPSFSVSLFASFLLQENVLFR